MNTEARRPHVGRPALRREDARHLGGTARFGSDIDVARLHHAVFVRSEIPHGVVANIDATEALALEGVRAVLTADDFGDFPSISIPWTFPEAKESSPPPPLLTDVARYVGDPVAVVIATDAYVAADAAALVIVDYEPFDGVSNARQATLAAAPLLHECAVDNTVFDRTISVGDVAAAVATADVVVRSEVRNQRVTAAPLEPRSTTVVVDGPDEMTTVYVSTQAPHLIKTELSRVAGIPEHRLRVIAPAVGGGFGAKLAFYREDAVVTIAAVRLGCNVRWTETRSECMVAMTHGRDHEMSVEVAATNDGTITALTVHSDANLGAYVSSMGMGVPGMNFAIMVGGMYDIANLDVRVRGVLTNTPPTDTYRGAGRPEATHLTERVVELVANATGVDSIEVRRRNFITDLPKPTSVGIVTLDSGDYDVTYNALLEHLDITEERRKRDASRAVGRCVGVGTAMYVEFTGLGNSATNRFIGFDRGGFEQAHVRMHPDGKATIYSGVSSHGQGHATTLAQIAADVLQMEPADIDVIQNDTALVPLGNGTYNSRSMVVGGTSASSACLRVVEKAKRFAAELLEADDADIELGGDGFFVSGTPSVAVTWADVGREAFLGGSGRGIEPGLEAVAAFDPKALVCSYGAHAAVVEIDPETGVVHLQRIVAVDDCGTLLNPLLATGQVHGGLAQGIGQAMFEHVVHDSAGYPETSSFYDYCIPRADQLPRFETHHTEHPTPLNPLGVKGVGEAGTVGIPPAIHAAVLDALSEFGVDQLDMPFTPERVWNAIHDHRQLTSAQPTPTSGGDR